MKIEKCIKVFLPISFIAYIIAFLTRVIGGFLGVDQVLLMRVFLLFVAIGAVSSGIVGMLMSGFSLKRLICDLSPDEIVRRRQRRKEVRKKRKSQMYSKKQGRGRKKNPPKKEYKKSYKGLIIMLLIFFVLGCVIGSFPVKNEKILSLMIMNFTTIWMTILTWIIYKTESIYWYSGLSFEEAKRASSDDRQEYAIRHFKRFAIFALIYALYSVITYFLNFPIILDFIIGAIGIIIVAISTIKIKL